MKNDLQLFLLLFIFIGLQACSATKGGGGFNFFTPEQDLAFGKQVNQEIRNNPKDYPILPERGNEEVYNYIRSITNNILNSGNVKFKDQFAWEVGIIDDDETLNAFATPGGYIYVYTGLIKYLDTESQLAGVMGHEIAHADLRHSTRQMTKIYGISGLLAIATGQADQGTLQQIAIGLINLKFSRSHETESDLKSVDYLCGTKYAADGAAGFFKKIGGSERPPEFLSTHPNPDNRVANIEGKAQELGCATNEPTDSKHQRIKRLLN